MPAALVWFHPLRSSACDERPSCLFEVDAGRGEGDLLGEPDRSGGRRRHVGCGQHRPFGQQHRALDDIAQLPDVARPSVGSQHLHRARLDAAEALSELRVECVDVVVDQQRDVAGLARSGGSSIGGR